MEQADRSAQHVLAGVRVGLIADTEIDLSAIERAVREAGAFVERLPLGSARWRRAEGYDIVLLYVDADGEADGGPESPSLQLLRSLVTLHRVIALVQRSLVLVLPGLRDLIFAPFRPQEVVARIARVVVEPEPAAELRAGNLSLHMANRMVMVDGQRVNLSYQEFEVLRALLAANGAVLSREDIAQHLGTTAEVGTRAVDIHIHRLRTKLRNAGLEQADIETVRRFGYRLDAAS